MKRLILATIFATLAIVTLKAQDSTQFIPDYGIESNYYLRIQKDVSGIDSSLVRYVYMYSVVEKQRIVANYSIEYFDIDTVLLKTKKNQRTELPLNDSIGNKAIRDYWNDIYSPADSLRIKGLLKYAITHADK